MDARQNWRPFLNATMRENVSRLEGKNYTRDTYENT